MAFYAAGCFENTPVSTSPYIISTSFERLELSNPNPVWLNLMQK